MTFPRTGQPRTILHSRMKITHMSCEDYFSQDEQMATHILGKAKTLSRRPQYTFFIARRYCLSNDILF